jgi:hypothetical protein
VTAIAEFDGVLPFAEAERRGLLESDQHRISCQIRFACALSKPDRDKYWIMVEERDGKEYMEKLRELALIHWNEKRGKPKTDQA